MQGQFLHVYFSLSCQRTRTFFVKRSCFLKFVCKTIIFKLLLQILEVSKWIKLPVALANEILRSFVWYFRINGTHPKWTRGFIPVSCSQDEQIRDGRLWTGKVMIIRNGIFLLSEVRTFCFNNLSMLSTCREKNTRIKTWNVLKKNIYKHIY